MGEEFSASIWNLCQHRIVRDLDSHSFVTEILVSKVNNGWVTRHTDLTSPRNWLDDLICVRTNRSETRIRLAGSGHQNAVAPRDYCNEQFWSEFQTYVEFTVNDNL